MTALLPTINVELITTSMAVEKEKVFITVLWRVSVTYKCEYKIFLFDCIH